MNGEIILHNYATSEVVALQLKRGFSEKIRIKADLKGMINEQPIMFAGEPHYSEKQVLRMLEGFQHKIESRCIAKADLVVDETLANRNPQEEHISDDEYEIRRYENI